MNVYSQEKGNEIMPTIYRILSVFVLMSLLSGCNIINVLKLRNANNDVEPVWLASQEQIQLKTDYIGEKVFVYGSINGVEGFKFMVDTGASFTILFDTPKVESLKLEEGYELNLSGWGDEQGSLGYQTTMKTLQFGDMQVNDFQGAFLRMSKTPYFIDANELIFDGVIGHDLLRYFTWTFDKRANQVTLSNQPFKATNHATQALPFDTFMSKISIEGKIDFGHGHQINHEFIIDTGSRHYFKLSSAYPESNDVVMPKASVTAADFGLNGKAEHQRVTLPSIQLGNVKLNHIKTNIIKNDDEDELWVIGNAALNQFVTTIDYQTSHLYLTPYADHKFKSKYNLLGLEVRKLLSGNFIIRYALPNLPAKKAGFKVGDIITKFNGVNAGDITKEQWLNFSSTPGIYNICLTSLDCKKIQAQHIKGYSQP